MCATWRFSFAVMLTIATMSAGIPARAQGLLVGGTGAALGFMRKVGEVASRDDPSLQIKLMPSMGSTGGVRALAENVLSLALVGRSLSSAEAAGGASEAVCFLTPFVFVTSAVGVSGITRSELVSYFSDERPTWSTGAPVRALLRPVNDAASPFLAELIPGMADALARARRRGEILIAASDQDNVDLAVSIAGSLTGATLTQLIADSIPLTRLTLDGIPPTVERMLGGEYPRGYKICVAQGRAPSEAAQRLIAWMRRPGMEAFYASLGMVRQ